QMLTATPIKESIILAEYPIALHEQTKVPESRVSLIINEEGEIVKQSDYDISFKVDIYKKDDNGKRIKSRDGFEQFWQPIPNVMVYAGGPDWHFPGGATVSDVDGQYVMTYVLPACPGFAYEYTIPITAQFEIDNFNPKAKGDLNKISAYRYDYKWCIGYGEGPPATGIIGQMAQLEARAIVATLATPMYDLNIFFSTMQLSGIGTMPGVEFANQTKYTEDSQVNQLGAGQYQFDFNLDGTADIAVINPDNTDLIDIYISPNQPTSETGERNPPDFIRLADYDLLNQLDDQGLLSEISQPDLEDTDIYVYRVSTGQLVASIEGLIENGKNGPIISNSNEEGAFVYQGVHNSESTATFGFTSLLVGAGSNDLTSRWNRANLDPNRRPWLDSEGNGTFDTRNTPSFVRPGEVLQIVVINRATGYMGTQNLIIQPSGSVLKPPTPILMGPPNLKIIASREFEDYNELTKATDSTVNIIGSEGAGLTSDKYVKIQSVWLNHDGNMLPDELPGYTGRVAVSTGSDTKDFSGNFEIKPGYQTQLVQFNNANDLNTEHFYVQVVGENYNGNPSFGSAGAGEGKLQTRPEKYVPIKVPLFDEESTRAAEYALAKGKLEGVADLPEQAEPVYRWVYRPEMQFSVFDFAKQKIKFTKLDETFQLVDLTSVTESELLSELLAEDLDFVELLFELGAPTTNELAGFGPDRELILSIGGEEGIIQLGSSGSIRFDNPDHISQLTAGDYTLISLYQNNDSANVLWAYNYIPLDARVDNNRDGIVQIGQAELTDPDAISDVTSETFPYRFWVNNDYDVV
ncbi:MAG: hypothetical protein GY697_03850, partial [Desulfobacterales bacterium]|nr:hypothetical protein [Desulfobacterales bacterium]